MNFQNIPTLGVKKSSKDLDETNSFPLTKVSDLQVLKKKIETTNENRKKVFKENCFSNFLMKNKSSELNSNTSRHFFQNSIDYNPPENQTSISFPLTETIKSLPSTFPSNEFQPNYYIFKNNMNKSFGEYNIQDKRPSQKRSVILRISQIKGIEKNVKSTRNVIENKRTLIKKNDSILSELYTKFEFFYQSLESTSDWFTDIPSIRIWSRLVQKYQHLGLHNDWRKFVQCQDGSSFYFNHRKFEENYPREFIEVNEVLSSIMNQIQTRHKNQFLKLKTIQFSEMKFFKKRKESINADELSLFHYKFKEMWIKSLNAIETLTDSLPIDQSDRPNAFNSLSGKKVKVHYAKTSKNIKKKMEKLDKELFKLIEDFSKFKKEQEMTLAMDYSQLCRIQQTKTRDFYKNRKNEVNEEMGIQICSCCYSHFRLAKAKSCNCCCKAFCLEKCLRQCLICLNFICIFCLSLKTANSCCLSNFCMDK